MATNPPALVQRIPQGLLGFFQIKEQGNPNTIQQTVSPGLEMFHWYLSTAAEQPGNSSVAITNNQTGFFAFTTNPIVVPEREWWYLIEFSLVAGLSAASDTIGFQPAYRTSTASMDFVLSTATASVTGNNRALGAASERGVFLPPGTILGAFIQECRTLTNVPVVGAARFTRLPI